MNNFKGYALFNDVTNKNLQAYNRFVTMFNVIVDTTRKVGNKDVGIRLGTEYANHFPKGDKVRMQNIGDLIKEKGVAAARAFINA